MEDVAVATTLGATKRSKSFIGEGFMAMKWTYPLCSSIGRELKYILDMLSFSDGIPIYSIGV